MKLANEKESNLLAIINESTPDAIQSLSLENLDSLGPQTTTSVPTLVYFSISSSDNDQNHTADQT